MDVTRWVAEQFLRFVLVASRVSGLFLVAPMLGDAGVPRRLKVGLAAIFALVILPALPGDSRAVNVGAMSLKGYLVAGLGELAVGLTIGLVAAIVLAGLQLAGLFVGRQTAGLVSVEAIRAHGQVVEVSLQTAHRQHADADLFDGLG